MLTITSDTHRFKVFRLYRDSGLDSFADLSDFLVEPVSMPLYPQIVLFAKNRFT
jgi:hypothetical protein